MIEELKKLIYPVPEKIDKINIEKNLFKIIRSNIMENNYEISVGPYILNINPEELKVFYETELSKIKLSLVDIYYETMRPLETKYYVITNDQKDTYSLDNPYYIVDNNIVNINGTLEEHYSFELVTNNPNLNIMDYLNIPNNYSIITNDEDGLTICREITPNETKTNPQIFFNNLVKSVYYDEEKDLFINKDNYKEETYQKYLPNLTKEKEIVTFIFNTMKDFYLKYQ